jgi:endoplasmic reticulum-Golgi intermediate compartment protein 3
LCCSLLIVVLVVSELKVFTSVETEHHLTIDSQAAQLDTVKIHLSATFFHLGCDDINLEMEATRGEGLEAEDDLVVKVPLGQGCMLRGDVSVAKVGGNFHVSTGTLGMKNSPLIMLTGGLFGGMMTGSFKGANLSHTIHSLSFGDNLPGIVNPLTEVTNIISNDVGQYQFHIKVIPTEYRPLRGAAVFSNQYSMYEQFVRLDLLSAMQSSSAPGIYFYYDFYPVMVQYHERKLSFLQFITRVCGVIGGVFTVAAVLDGIFHRANEQIKKQH